MLMWRVPRCAAQAEQEAALAQESARASRLEAAIVAAQADCTDTEAALQVRGARGGVAVVVVCTGAPARSPHG